MILKLIGDLFAMSHVLIYSISGIRELISAFNRLTDTSAISNTHDTTPSQNYEDSSFINNDEPDSLPIVINSVEEFPGDDKNINNIDFEIDKIGNNAVKTFEISPRTKSTKKILRHVWLMNLLKWKKRRICMQI